MPEFPEFPLTDRIRVIPGEPYRFFVRSRSRPHIWHLVDLEEVGFNGMCGCEDFRFNLMKFIKKDLAAGNPPRTRRCSHIKDSMIFWADMRIRIQVRHDAQKKLT